MQIAATKKQSHGIYFRVINLLLYSYVTVIVKIAAKELNYFQIMFMYGSIGAAISYLIHRHFLPSKPLRFDRVYIVRGGFNLGAMATWILAIQTIKLTEATAISYLYPIFSVIFGVMFFREKFTRYTLLGLILSMVGMAIILKPNFANMALGGAVLAVVSALCLTSDHAISKHQSHKDGWIEQSMYLLFWLAVLTAPMAIWNWKWMDVKTLLIIIAISVMWVANKALLVSALARTDLTILSCVTFVKLVYVSIFAYIHFGEVLDKYSVIGVVVILMSTLIALRSSIKKDREIVADAEKV